jgi:hypothetical protein
VVHADARFFISIMRGLSPIRRRTWTRQLTSAAPPSSVPSTFRQRVDCIRPSLPSELVSAMICARDTEMKSAEPRKIEALCKNNRIYKRFAASGHGLEAATDSPGPLELATDTPMASRSSRALTFIVLLAAAAAVSPRAHAQISDPSLPGPRLARCIGLHFMLLDLSCQRE